MTANALERAAPPLTQDFETTLYAVYGSLRQGFWNYDWALSDIPLVGITKVQGYEMGDNGCFPAVFKTDKPSEVVVELYDTALMDPTSVEHVDGMEFGCGYVKRLVLTEDGHSAWMFVMPDDNRYHYDTPVPGGDWVKFKEEGRQ